MADLDRAIQSFVNNLPGQKEFQTCADIINQCSDAIQGAPEYNGPFHTKFSNTNDLQNQLQACSRDLNECVNAVVHCCSDDPQVLPACSLQCVNYLREFVFRTLDFYLTFKDRTAVEPQKMLQVLEKLVYSASVLLDTSRQVFAASGPGSTADVGAQLHPKLTAAARASVGGINAVLDLVLQSSPGLKHCDSAIRNIEVCVSSKYIRAVFYPRGVTNRR